jgi:hypothetical protein
VKSHSPNDDMRAVGDFKMHAHRSSGRFGSMYFHACLWMAQVGQNGLKRTGDLVQVHRILRFTQLWSQLFVLEQLIDLAA